MARTVLTAVAPPAAYPTLPLTALSAQFTPVAADTVNFNAVKHTGRELLLAQNTAGAPGTVTVTSSPDPFNRTGDIATYSIPAAGFAVLGPFPVLGWRQVDGNLYFQGSAATILFTVFTLPTVF